ncbi:S9 family peptidase [Marinilabilia rubra]|uniref:S9 family peptidase n=1 Tax=Marinilabilia rubra TaxID=2162893 RepID=A0A2U2B4D2_9BACT|nr:S9 family peptidase [Marinilabilia rubra]PWD97918.1 S9 family peptidase [Marinilabilia rubra]
MKKLKLALLLALASMTIFGLTFSCQNANAKKKAVKIPMEDFFRNPEKTAFQISPNGKFLSFLAPYENRMNVYVKDLHGDSAVRVTSETARDIAGYFWANNERLLFLKDTGGDENFSLYGVNRNGEEMKALTEFEGVRTTMIDDLPDIEEEVIIGLNKRNARVFDPYRLNIETGEMEMLAENPGNIQGWVTDHDGKLRAAVGIEDGVNTTLLYRDSERDSFEVVIKNNFKNELNPYFFTFDNEKIYAVSNLERDKKAPVIFNPKTGEIEEVLYENDEYDVTGLSYSRKRKVLTTASYTSWKRQRHFFDKEAQQLFESLEEDLGEYEIAITDSDKPEKRFIIRTYSDRSLGAYYYYDSENDELNKIADVSPWLDEENMAGTTPVKYQSRDGLTIHGYLTLPKGYSMESSQNLPVVVNPHGGPWYRDSWGFNPEVQFMANRGYAVFQMNFRGSTGYGKEFWEASFKQWGLSMQDDITDGVKWLIEKGIADPERVAIYGGSYGGYATLAGMTFTPELYAAGVDYVGVSNLFTFMNTIPPYWEPLLDMMYEMVGHPKKDSLQLRETSPVFHADKIEAPLFIAQGANDPRVNKDESDQMVEALKKRGVEVQYMVKDNEGHGFRNEENRFDFYGAMEKFLAKHLNGEEVRE